MNNKREKEIQLVDQIMTNKNTNNIKYKAIFGNKNYSYEEGFDFRQQEKQPRRAFGQLSRSVSKMEDKEGNRIS